MKVGGCVTMNDWLGVLKVARDKNWYCSLCSLVLHSKVLLCVRFSFTLKAPTALGIKCSQEQVTYINKGTNKSFTMYGKVPPHLPGWNEQIFTVLVCMCARNTHNFTALNFESVCGAHTGGSVGTVWAKCYVTCVSRFQDNHMRSSCIRTMVCTLLTLCTKYVINVAWLHHVNFSCFLPFPPFFPFLFPPLYPSLSLPLPLLFLPLYSLPRSFTTSFSFSLPLYPPPSPFSVLYH